MIGKIARHRVDELMDSPALAPQEHVRALEGLVTINRLSLTAGILLPKILALAQRLNRDNLTLLDVACGAGDVPLALYNMAARHGIRLELTLADRSVTALAQARKMEASTLTRNLKPLVAAAWVLLAEGADGESALR